MRFFKTQVHTNESVIKSLKVKSAAVGFPVVFVLCALIACHASVSTFSGCSFDTSGISIKDPGFVCGNGIIERDQECDDGNNVSGDGCSADCRIEPGWVCYGEPSVCHTICGDGITTGDEECDDGNLTPGDGCSPACTVEPGWECHGEPSMCTPVCGDGIVAGGLECDDGNNEPGDGCSPECTVERGWDCYGQPSVCYTTCGDGIIAGDEECDDGANEPGDGCSPECTVEPGWECSGEPSVCTPVCGDGIVAGGLECDDGNNEPGDGCSPECTVEPGWYCYGRPSVCYTVCGDGIVAGDEECDDGNNEPGDGCSPTCEIEPYYYCEGDPSVCNCVVLVDIAAPLSPHTGASWAVAYPTLQEGIEHAADIVEASGHIDHCEVWVAEGEYFVRDTSANDTIALASNVAVYGGFDGTEHMRSGRDPEVFITILDGRENENSSNHANHVVTANGTHNAVLDGFTIQNGLTGNEGAGLLAQNSQNLHIENCRFEHNEAINGGAVFLAAGSAVILYSTFISNIASSNHGGGIFADNMNIFISDCTFETNTANERGGALYMAGSDSMGEIRNSVFGPDNHAYRGAAVYVREGDMRIFDSLFTQNAADCRGGNYFRNGDFEIRDSYFEDNHAENGGAFYFRSGNLSVSNSVFLNNSSDLYGGAVYLVENVLIENTIFQSNSSIERGGAAYGDEDSWVGMVNTIFNGNTSDYGGAYYGASDSTFGFVNSLFYANEAFTSGGGIRNYRGAADIVNTIMWNNVSNNYTSHEATVYLSYSNIQGLGQGVGVGNINEDPLFVDPGNGNFRLQSGSPCIDAADGDWAPEFDMDGNPRADDPATENTGRGDPDYADIGPYEYQP